MDVAKRTISNRKRAPAKTSGKTFCEFFAGIGLVGEGLRPSGWRCVYANDNDLSKRKLFEARNGETAHFHLEDVRNTATVTDQIKGRPFLATASFPCTDLSVAGHYRGLKGLHSSTFFSFVDVLASLGNRRPPLVLLENVSGFLTSRGGGDFANAVETLSSLGYWIDAFMVDARHFVPQSRPRVFVVGVADGMTIPQKPRGQWVGVDATHPAALVKLMTTICLSTGWLGLSLPAPPPRHVSLADVIDLDTEQNWWKEAELERHYRMMHDRHRARIDELVAAKEDWVGTIFRRVRQGQQRAEVRFDGLAGCLRTPSGGSAKQIVVATVKGELKMRWMSPREYASLQGVRGFPLDATTNELLWAFADAVCVPAISWIDEQVLSPIYAANSDWGDDLNARQSHTGAKA